MANPFKTKFNSECQECGNHVDQGTLMFRNEDGKFVCRQCAEEGENVCYCGNFKKAQYKTCFECNQKGIKTPPGDAKPDDDIDPEDVPW